MSNYIKNGGKKSGRKAPESAIIDIPSWPEAIRKSLQLRDEKDFYLPLKFS